MPSSPQVITRFAPSPTGHLHIGGARTALFCWAFARRNGGHFILRIEDTDQARSSDESARGIMEDLAWLGIEWDEGPVLEVTEGRSDGATKKKTIGGDPRGVGPFFQARRVALYNKFIMQLVEQGKAYPAFETNEELDAKRKAVVAAKQTYRYDKAALAIPLADRLNRMSSGEAHVVRFNAPHEEVVVHDTVLGDVKYAAGEMDDFVIRKADGFPTYHFAVVADDETMGVTHVMRAQEHLNNSPRHVALQKALGFRIPSYAHMPLIFNMDGSKMSKRDKAKVARLTLQAVMQKDKALTTFAAASRLRSDEKLVADFLSKENDSLEVAEAIAREFKIALPEVEVSDFRANGYVPSAITNFLGLLGWNPGMKQPDGKDLEKFDMKFIAEHFGVDRIGKTNAKFDRAKLGSFNGDVITGMTDEEFAAAWGDWCREYEPEFFRKLDSHRFAILAKAVKQRAKTMRDGVKSAAFVMREDGATDFDKSAVEKNLLANDRAGMKLLVEFRQRVAALPSFEPGPIHTLIEDFAQEKGLPNVGGIAQPVRVAIAGAAVSPPLGETLAVIGREGTVKRIDTCLKQVG